MKTAAMRRPLTIALTFLLAVAVLGGCKSSHQYGHHDQTILHDNVTLTDGEVVAGNLNIVDGHVTCDGATIEGDVRTYFGTFDQTDDCVVRGSVTDAFNGQSAVVFAPWLAPDPTAQFAAEEHRVMLQSAYGIIVLIMFLLFPLRTRTALDRVEHHPGLAALVGTLAAVAVIPVAILLAISVIGIPLILVEIAALLGTLWIGEAAVALLIGRRFYELVRPHATPSPLGALVVGLALITAGELLPVVGWAVWAIVSLVGVGCAIMAFLQERNFARFQRPGGPPGPDGSGPQPPGATRGTPPGPGVPMRSS